MLQKNLFFAIIVAVSIFQTACIEQKGNDESQNDLNKTETNKKIIKRAYESFNKGDLEAYAQFFAPNVKNHGEEVGREGIKFVINDIIHTFPDVNLVTMNMFADGDWVITRDIFKGTFKNKATVPHHGGLVMINEPTGKSFSVQHIHMFKIENNLISEHYACRDDIEMYQQSGVLPPAPVFAPPSSPAEKK